MTICSNCAANKGLVPKDKGYGVGMWVATCPYCRRNVSLCDEIHDYKYPGQKLVTLEGVLITQLNLENLQRDI